MSAVEAADSLITVLLCDERTLRRECLAGFLERSGVRMRILAVDNQGSDAAGSSGGGRANLAIIDTGERSCSHPRVRSCSHPRVKRIFDDLRSTLPSVPIVVISDREDGPAVIDAMQLGVRAYFPSSLDPKILVETPVRRSGGQAELSPVA
jgi:DNA-binding NarL/FixJ family response regulator